MHSAVSSWMCLRRITQILWGKRTAFARSAITPLHRKWMRSGTVWAKCGGWFWQILGAIRAVATVWEGSFFKKTLKKLLTKFRRHNFTMITNAENSRPNGPPMGCLVSTFNVRIDSRFPLRRCAPESDLPKFSATSVLRYRPIVCYSTGAAQSHRYGWLWCGLLSDILKKSRLNWKLKVSNTADNAGITQSQTRDTIGIVECRN